MTSLQKTLMRNPAGFYSKLLLRLVGFQKKIAVAVQKNGFITALQTTVQRKLFPLLFVAKNIFQFPASVKIKIFRPSKSSSSVGNGVELVQVVRPQKRHCCHIPSRQFIHDNSNNRLFRFHANQVPMKPNCYRVILSNRTFRMRPSTVNPPIAARDHPQNKNKCQANTHCILLELRQQNKLQNNRGDSQWHPPKTF